MDHLNISYQRMGSPTESP